MADSWPDVAFRTRTAKRVLAEAAARLRCALSEAPEGSAETPYLDATILLAEALGTTREHLFASLEEPLDDLTAERFARLLERRSSGVPVSYILGRKEFFGRTFMVDERVLVPRPETEHLVEAVLELRTTGDLPDRALVHDCCTGSGCVAITLKLELPDLRVSASDISAVALEVARTNAQQLVPPDEAIAFSATDLLVDATEPFDLITANPPYVESVEVGRLTDRGWPEPVIALDGGEAGTEVLARLARAAFERLADGGYLVSEIGFDQGAWCREILDSVGYADTEIVSDLAGRDRVVKARRR